MTTTRVWIGNWLDQKISIISIAKKNQFLCSLFLYLNNHQLELVGSSVGRRPSSSQSNLSFPSNDSFLDIHFWYFFLIFCWCSEPSTRVRLLFGGHRWFGLRSFATGNWSDLISPTNDSSTFVIPIEQHFINVFIHVKHWPSSIELLLFPQCNRFSFLKRQSERSLTFDGLRSVGIGNWSNLI